MGNSDALSGFGQPVSEALATHAASPRLVPRMWRCMWRQQHRLIAQPRHRVDGSRVLITGGNGGIGFATAKRLLELGADVVLACRSETKAQGAVQRLREQTGRAAQSVPCDLDDLDSVAQCAAVVASRYGALDRVVFNAGVWPTRYGETRQGFERAFGVNVLAHVLLTESLLRHGAIEDGGRVVWLTGDIYIMVDDCTPEFSYRGMWGGQLAYCRSKLGDLWMRHAYEARHPQIGWYAAHPGVVSTNLGASGARWLRDLLLIHPAQGARASVACVTDPDLRPCYLHNTMGVMRLDPSDPGADRTRAVSLHARCLELLSDYLAPQNDKKAVP